MANNVSLSTLRTRARRRADMEFDTSFISNAEALSLINESYAELYDILTSEFGEEYFLTSYNISAVSGTDTYALPANFYLLRAVDVQSGSDWIDVNRFKLAERNLLQNSTSGVTSYYYSLQGSNIKILPTPTTSETFRIWYVPVFTALAIDTDVVDGVNGWENYIVVDAARKMLAKEESDTTELEKEKQQIIMRIKRMAKNRDSGQPKRIKDVEVDYDLEFIPRLTRT